MSMYITRQDDGSWLVTKVVRRIWSKVKRRDENGELKRVKLQEPLIISRSDSVVKRRSSLLRLGIKPFRSGTKEF